MLYSIRYRMVSMSSRPALLLALALTLPLAGCGGGAGFGGLPDRVWPPQTSVQELRRLPDGDWQLTVRLQNFSTVPVRFDSLEFRLVLDGHEAGGFHLQPNLRLGPLLAEPFEVRLSPTREAGEALRMALESGREARYTLTGEVLAGEPRGRWPQRFEGVLSPVPGLADVLRGASTGGHPPQPAGVHGYRGHPRTEPTED